MPVWVERPVVLAIHDAQLAEHGGLAGLRDDNALDSALARPRHLDAYGEPGPPDIAAAYAFGLARNHPFGDGNKRTSFVVTELFLALNGLALTASDEEVVRTWLALASAGFAEPALAAWLVDNTAPI